MAESLLNLFRKNISIKVEKLPEMEGTEYVSNFLIKDCTENLNCF